MKAIEELISLVSSKINAVMTLAGLIKLETRLAGLSIFPLLLNLCMLFVILLATWLSAMVLLGYSKMFFFPDLLIAISSVFLFNLIFLGLLLKYLLFNLKKMSFEKTRKFLSMDRKTHDERQKKSDDRNRRDRKKIVATTSGG